MDQYYSYRPVSNGPQSRSTASKASTSTLPSHLQQDDQQSLIERLRSYASSRTHATSPSSADESAFDQQHEPVFLNRNHDKTLSFSGLQSLLHQPRSPNHQHTQPTSPHSSSLSSESSYVSHASTYTTQRMELSNISPLPVSAAPTVPMFNDRHVRTPKQDSKRAAKYKERPFKCDECGMRFIKKDHAIKHWKAVHLNHRPYKCDTCGAQFGQRSDLNKHVRAVHLGLKPFECKYCGRRFSHRGNQLRHESAVHGNQSKSG